MFNTNSTISNAISTSRRCDLNCAEARGVIVSIRPRANGLILIRVRLGPPLADHADPNEENSLETAKQPEADSPTIMTLALPDGQIDGQDVSAFVGDRIAFSGWVCDLPYEESFQGFLGRCKKALSDYPELSTLLPLTIQRSECCIIPEEYQRMGTRETPGEQGEGNFVQVEGVIARVWEYGSAALNTPNQYARIAIYDRCARSDETGKQVPHYLSVQFTRGQVDGRSITIHPRRDGDGILLKSGDRIRVRGRFIHRRYWENLRDFLHDAKRIDLLTTLPNSDTLVENLRALYLQSCVEAIHMIQYS